MPDSNLAPFHPSQGGFGHVATITITLPDWAAMHEAAHRAALDCVEAQAELLRSAIDEALAYCAPIRSGQWDVHVDVYDDEHPFELCECGHDVDDHNRGYGDECLVPGCDCKPEED